MTKLYVANTTVQFRDFMAIVPETGAKLRQKIRPGHQAMVYEGSSYAIDGIIKQNEIYGLRRENEVKDAKGFVGMVYQIDRQIDRSTFGLADNKNHKALIEFGSEIRENVANYAQASILDTMRQAGEESKGMQIEIKDLAKDPVFHEVYAPEQPKEIEAKKRGRPKKG